MKRVTTRSLCWTVKFFESRMTKKTLVTKALILVFSRLLKYHIGGTNSLRHNSIVLVSWLVVFFSREVQGYWRIA